MLNANRLADAERHFRDLVSRFPLEPSTHHALGVALIRLQRHSDAIVSFETSLALQPSAESYLNLIQLFFFTGRKIDAVTRALHAQTAFPNDPRIAAELARALERTGDADGALKTCETALARFPNLPVLVTHAANLLFSRGKILEAITLYRQALAAYPHDPRLHSALLFTLHFLPVHNPCRRIAAEHAGLEPPRRTHRP